MEEKPNDKLAIKAVQSATVGKKAKKQLERISESESLFGVYDLAYDIAYQLAKNLYVKTKSDVALVELGISYSDILKIRRDKGRPKKVLFSNEQIVQLVYRQNLQNGTFFNNKAGLELNECIIAVSENLNVGVDLIVKQYKSVPQLRRKAIKEFVKKYLTKHNLLSQRHINKNL